MKVIVRKGPISFSEESNLFTNTEHSICPGTSCLTHLSAALPMWTETATKLVTCRCDIYLDFLKTLEHVDPEMISHKLQILGIDWKIGEWLHAFLKVIEM